MYLLAAIYDDQLSADKNMVLPLDAASVIGAVSKLVEKFIQLDRNGLIPDQNSGLFHMEKKELKFCTFDVREIRKYFIESSALEYFRLYIVTPILREIAIPNGRSYWIRYVLNKTLLYFTEKLSINKNPG
jgi:hypothetical protein